MRVGRAVALLSLAAFGSAASLRATDPLLALIVRDYGVTAGGASAVITAFALSYGLFQIVHGPLGDRIGKFRLIALATAVSALTSFLGAVAPGLEALIAARFVAGITVGAMIPLAMAWIGDCVPYAERQATIARFLIGQATGVGCGAGVSGVLADAFGWRSVFVVLGALFTVIAILLFAEMRSNELARARGRADTSIGAAFVRMLRLLSNSWARAVLLTAYVEGALAQGAFAFIAWHLHEDHGVSLAASGWFVAAFPAGGLLYAVAATRVVPLLGERGLVLWGGCLIGLAYLGLLLAPGAHYALPAILLVGTGLYMLHNTLQVHATQMAPEARGGAVALFAFFLFTGQSSGIWLAAQVVDHWGVGPVFAVAAFGLPLLALDFRRRLGRRERALAPASGS